MENTVVGTETKNIQLPVAQNTETNVDNSKKES